MISITLTYYLLEVILGVLSSDGVDVKAGRKC